MKLRKIRIIAFAASAALAIAIFCFSAQSSNESSDTSGAVIRFICRLFYPDFELLSAEKSLKIVENLSFFVRKAAHFSIYFALGASTFCGFFTFFRLKLYLRVVFAFAVCVLYSVSDEIHQYFVPGRSCEFRDVCIDSSGALLAFLFGLCFYKIYKSRRIKKERGLCEKKNF